MTDKQAAAFDRSDARRAAQGLPPVARGVGDIVAHITSALHIPQCGGCKKRQAALNSLLPFDPPSEPTK